MTSTLEDTSLRTKLEQLTDRKQVILSELTSIGEAVRELMEARDSNNVRMKELFLQAEEERTQRDAANAEIAVLKEQRRALQLIVDGHEIKIQELNDRLREMGASRKRHPKSSQLERLERELETTANLSKEKEEELIEKMKLLAEEMKIEEEAQGVRRQRNAEIREKNKSLREIRKISTRIKKLVRDSQKHHNTMHELTKEARGLRKKANQQHREIVSLRDQRKILRAELGQIQKERKQILETLHESRKEFQKRKQSRDRQKKRMSLEIKAREAEKGLKAGQKISLDALKALLMKEGSLPSEFTDTKE